MDGMVIFAVAWNANNRLIVIDWLSNLWADMPMMIAKTVQSMAAHLKLKDFGIGL
jgi:hypothetical protein